MDLGDIIIPLVLIGGALVQWWASRRKGSAPETQEPDSYPGDQERSFQPERKSDADFGDLMEALGQGPKKDTVQENRIPPPPIPPSFSFPMDEPVIVRRPIQEPPVYVARAQPETVMFEQITSRDDDLAKRFSQFSSFDIKEASDAALLPKVAFVATKASQQNRWRQDLRSRTTLRKIVVLNEILQPPVALR